MLFLWFTASARECDPALLDLALEAAERAYVASDSRSVGDAVTLAHSSLCPSTTPLQHARLHRARALSSLLQDDLVTASEDLRSANAAYPLLTMDGPLQSDMRLTRLWVAAQEKAIHWTVRGQASSVNGLQTPLLPDTALNTTRRGPRKGLLLAGLAVGAIGAGVYGTAFLARSDYKTAVAGGDIPKIRSKHTATNALTLTGIGLGTVGGALVVTGLL